MPRPGKAIRRLIINASTDYKKGKRAEAYAAWEKAATARKAATEAKRNKKKKAAEAAAAEAAKSEASA